MGEKWRRVNSPDANNSDSVPLVSIDNLLESQCATESDTPCDDNRHHQEQSDHLAPAAVTDQLVVPQQPAGDESVPTRNNRHHQEQSVVAILLFNDHSASFSLESDISFSSLLESCDGSDVTELQSSALGLEAAKAPTPDTGSEQSQNSSSVKVSGNESVLLEHEVLSSKRKIARKGTADPRTWKRNAKALKRMHGEGRQPRNSICSCCVQTLDVTARDKLFKEFWAVDWTRKTDFIINNTAVTETARKTAGKTVDVDCKILSDRRAIFGQSMQRIFSQNLALKQCLFDIHLRTHYQPLLHTRMAVHTNHQLTKLLLLYVSMQLTSSRRSPRCHNTQLSKRHKPNVLRTCAVLVKTVPDVQEGD